ncbi:MAG: hypothetical protein NTY84_09930 [Verrucomicrobia bacterium]|nr:hypothetical protein [Verrucomicrobiota bacterium]
MWGCRNRESVRASRSNRSTKAGSAANSRGNTLSAEILPESRSRTRYTQPIPPVPKCPSTSSSGKAEAISAKVGVFHD